MKLILFILIPLSLILISCDEAVSQPAGTMPVEFATNPDARAAFDRMTQGNTGIPSHFELDREINGDNSLTAAVTTPTCETCGVVTEGAAFSGGAEGFDGLSQTCEEMVGNYQDFSEQCRGEFVQLIMEGGRDRHATTTLNLPGGRFQVFNDALTLPDGTYVNFTLAEAKEVARRWGCRLPNYDQAQAIREYAERQNAVYNARTRPWDNGIHNNMEAMMTDPEMRRRAEAGRSRLINGHFKWYIDDGSNQFRFYGFHAPPNCYGASRSGPYCQNRGSSGGHGNSYIDYSQSVRLICPAS